jgi:hypothetical protein
MRSSDGGLVAVGADADDEVLSDHATQHSAPLEKGEPPEHPPLLHTPCAEQAPHAFRQSIVEGHAVLSPRTPVEWVGAAGPWTRYTGAMSGPPTEFAVTCPYCGETTEVYVEPDVRGSLVQDCEVCCQPWVMTVSEHDEDRVVEVRRADGSD